MRTHLRNKGLLALAAILLIVPASFAYDQATVATYGASAVEKSAAAAPNDLTSFTNAVALAFATNSGGVFNLPTTVPNPTTLFRGTYAAGQRKRLSLTASNPMQNVTSSGSFVPVSSPNGTTTTTALNGYNLTVGPVTDTNGVALPEAVVRLGLTVLSRTHATYPLDVTVTVTFSDGTSQSLTANIGGTKGTDDTFYGFLAPGGLSITNLAFAGFATGTTTPVSTQIAFDDLGFVTASSVPPPQVLNVSPFNYELAGAAGGVQFDALSYLVPIDAGGISLVLNSNDVSSQLVITGDATNRHVVYAGLAANQSYDMLITVSNEVGVATSYSHFYTMESPFTLFDSGGFSDAGLYPPGTLMSFTNGNWAWLAPVDAASILDTGEPGYGPVLRQMQMGIDETTYLDFPPLASGAIRISFDARVSNPYVRTIDLGLNSSGGTQGSFVAWGMITNQFGTNTGEFAYYNGSAWVPLVAVDTGWHHYELTNFISGPGAGNFAVAVDGVVVGQLLPWRTVLPLRTPMGRLRLATRTGAVMEYGDVDNLFIQGGPEVRTVLPLPQILNVTPANSAVARPADGFQFDAFSFAPIEPAGIALVLNSNVITSGLTLSGTATNRHVLFSGLAANTIYDAVVVVSNIAGMTTNTSRFYAADPALTLVQTIDFADSALFPLGPLGAVGTNGWTWTPPPSAAQIMDTGEAAYGPVLRITQMGAGDQQARLNFTPTLSGILRVAFDARVSNPFDRTLDVSVDTATGGQQSSFIGWGVVTNTYGTNSGQLAYYNGTAWVPLLGMDTNWHHFELINYCGGPNISKFDLTVDGALVGRLLPWRHPIIAQTPLGILRIGASRGTAGDYGEVDNISVTIGPALASPGTISLLNPSCANGVFRFSFASQLGVLYTVQTFSTLGGNSTDMVTMLGDGTVKTVTDTNLTGTKFYRVRAQ